MVYLSFLFEEKGNFVGNFSHYYYKIISFLADCLEKTTPFLAEGSSNIFLITEEQSKEEAA